MSENDDVQNDAWKKNTTSTPAAATIAGSAARLPYSIAPPVVHFSGGISGTQPDTKFSSARFQAPPFHQQHANNPTMTSLTSQSHLAVSGIPTIATTFASQHSHHHTTIADNRSPIASSNVPVYPTAAATSVLTPNPFAVAATGAPTTTVLAPIPPTTARPFALQQFFHVMNTAAAASLVGNAAVATPLNLNTPSPSQIVIPTGMATSPASNSGLSRSTNIDLPSPSSTSSLGTCGPVGSGSAILSGTNVGVITNTITENVLNAISGASQSSAPARNMGFGIKAEPDEEKLRRVRQMIEAGIGEQAKQQIVQILDCISTLKPVEKLLLYLRMPSASPETDPLRQPQNPLGTRSEISHTINWVRSHLEQDPHVSIPKQDVYTDYIAYCDRLDIKPLSTADFGKVMKQVFPGIRPRRLGTRGHSRYCYAAMRKTTKLASPELPQLGSESSTNKSSASGESHLIESFFNINDHSSSGGSETWSTIKTWAESLLQIKINDARDLAERIKTGNMPGVMGNIAAGGTRINITHKKFGNRETKEKRYMTDIGPLKKRRKKKRKGSSSSESSYYSQPPQKQLRSEKESLQVTKITATASQSSEATIENESNTLVKVKEELLEPPNSSRIRHLASPNEMKGRMNESFLQHQELSNQHRHQQQTQQQQIWPMNLAPEQRSVLTRAPPTSALNVAKNLVPKLIELATVTTADVEPQGIALISTIKEEEQDDYNTSNILCKKVRKAQQTKGFWQQAAIAGTTVAVTSALTTPTISQVTTSSRTLSGVPVITKSAPTPTPNDIPSRSVAGNTPSPVSNYLMGPPAAASSTSPFAATDASSSVTPTPKVASRNMQQLRAKKLQLAQAQAAAAAAAATATEGHSTNPADDLPENLGLPRERVISICNMDKHELDDYFINGEEEEENSNEPDTELLQYFQTGDAEEKLNSLDAGKQRNPTATAALGVNNQSPNVSAAQLTLAQQSVQLVVATTATATNIALPLITTTASSAAALTTALTSTVGSASASLTLMSQKHQQVQQQQQQSQRKEQLTPQHSQVVNSVTTKRKLLPTKHCTFAPISPNINSSSTFTANTVSADPIGNRILFASPGISSTRLRPKPAPLAKQHSLDVDLTSAIPFPSPSMTTMHDPMIGASRRRRNYVSATSASAPPSPSILHQQQHQHLFNPQQFQNAANQWLTTTSFLNDQNSLDLDLFGGANGSHTTSASHYGIAGGGNGVLLFDDYATETQRSQSVPLSQLQRVHSPSMMGTPSLMDSTSGNKHDFIIGDNSFICSENSSSQHSNATSATISAAATAAFIKLEDPAAGDVMASDSAALLDSVDVNEILSSPDFVQNFTSIAQQGNCKVAATTTCSSAGSSSGYSSGTCTTFTGGSNIMSRSVPSTPLPHHHQNLFGQTSVNFYSQRRRSGVTSNELQLSLFSGFSNGTNKYINSNNNNTSHNSENISLSNSFGSRSIYDISKSMPTTPITTPSFRYSPEFNRDFLINGNTIDDSISFNAGVGSDSLMTAVDGPNTVSAVDDGDSVNLVSNLNPDALLTAHDVSVPGADDVLLGNL